MSNPEYLHTKFNKSNIIGILRTNTNNYKKILSEFNKCDSYYFIHFLDGDGWGKRDIWLNERGAKRYDIDTSNALFNMIEYKDCISQWADEYVLISKYNMTKEIENFLKDKDFSMTHIYTKTKQGSIHIIAKLSNEVRMVKEIQRGKTYYLELGESQ